MYIIFFLLIAANVAAQESYVIDSVCVDAERFYRVNGENGSTYLWAVTDTAGDTVFQSPGTSFADQISFELYNYGSELQTVWNTTGTYLISTIQWSIHGCDTMQQGYVKVFDPPYAFAGNTQYMCNIDTINLNEADAGYYSSLIWTTIGDGTFNDSSLVNPQYMAGPTDKLNGMATLVITANGLALNETCTPATDTIEIWFSNPVVTFRARDLLCYNDYSGYIKAEMSGGNEPFVYEWSGPNGYTASADSIFGLAAGEYRLTITNNIGCQVTDTVILTQPEELIAIIDSSENVVCFGGNDGYARVLATGGTGDNKYSWGTWPPQNTAEAVNLTAGEYIINVTDENSCVSTTVVTITEPPLLVLSADSVDAKCLGSTGSVDLTVTGGTPFANEPHYLYEWSDDNGIFTTTEDITGLNGNQLYTVVVTDSVGCIDTLSILVNEENDIVLTIENIDSILCYNESTGAIDITVIGGTEPYIFTWNSGETTEDLINIPAGDYDVSVTDANGCNQVMSFTLFNPEELIATVSANVNEICENDTIFLNSIAMGGTGNHTHMWSGIGAIYLNATGIADPVFSGAPAGSYTLTYSVADENNCLVDTTLALEVWPITYNTVFDTICDSELPYTWNKVTYLAAGIYENMTTNSFGCDSVITFNLFIYEEIILTASTVNDGLLAEPSGSIDLSVTGGTSPFTFSWSNGQTTEDISGLTAGDYTVTVTDFNGCTETLTVTVSSDLGDIIVEAIPSPVDCYGNNTGSIDLTVSGGVPNYTFIWSNGETTQNISSLIAGTYTVTVTDAKGASMKISVEITEPAQIVLSATRVDVGNSPDPVGSINLRVQGGTGPYEFLWSGSNGFTSTSEDINNLPKGNYTVIVTDANGCTEILAVVISGYGMTCPPPVFVDCSIDNAPLPYTTLAQYEAAGGNIVSTSALLEVTFTVVGTDVSDGKKCPETFTRTYTIQNADGDWITCEQLIIVNDIIKPELVLARLRVNCPEDKPAIYMTRAQFEAQTGNRASDDCELDWSTFRFLSESSDFQTCPEQITRWYEISDKCGITTQAMQIIEIDDELRPVVFRRPADIKTDCEIPIPYRNYADFQAAGGVVTDNCSNVVLRFLGETEPSGICPMTIVRTYVFEDICGNVSAEYKQNIIINDTVLPVIGCPEDVAFDADLDELAILTGLAFSDVEITIVMMDTTKLVVSASDNCNLVKITYSDEVSGACPAVVTRTFTAYDGCNNISACEQMIELYNKVPVAVSIAVDKNPICTGEKVTFTATPTNGGDKPVYAWFVNGEVIPGETDIIFKYKPEENDEIYVKLTSNETCVIDLVALSDTITIAITDGLLVDVEIDADKTVICDGETVTFTATPVNGGDNPVYAWFVNGLVRPGETDFIFRYQPKENDEIYVKLISNETCVIDPEALSDTIIIAITDGLLVEVEIDADKTIICDGETVTFTAAPVNGGDNPVYAWFVNGLVRPGETKVTFSYKPKHSDDIYVKLTSGETCIIDPVALSDTITITVTDGLPVKVDITADKTEICDGETVTFTAIPENGGDNPVYAWYVNGMVRAGEDSVSFAYEPKDGDKVYVKLTSGEICVINPVALSDTIIIDVTDDLIVSVSIPKAALVCESEPVTLTATTINGGTNPVYTWFVNGEEITGENSDTFTYNPDDKDEIFVTVESDIICIKDNTGTSNVVIISVGDILPPVAICRNDTVYLDAEGKASVTTAQIDNGSNDNCKLDTIFLSRYDFDCDDLGKNPVTLTAIDAVGLIDECVATVTVLDTIKPVVICRGPFEIQLDENAEYKLTVAEVLDTIYDVCGGVDTMYVYPYELNCDHIGLTTITLLVVDVNGDSAYCETEVMIYGNRPPIVIDDSATTVQNVPLVIDVIDNDYDEKTSIDVSSMAISIRPRNGTVSVNPVNGDITYIPNLNFTGVDVFEYRICDDGIPCDPECGKALVYIVVRAVNVAPVALNDYYEAGCFSVTGNVLDNDYDIDSDNLTINTNPLIPTNHGTLIIDYDGTITYFPNDGFVGIDSFQYEIYDAGIPVLYDSAWVYINVDCSEESPDPLECELFIPEGFSPNEDGIHDFFRIMCIHNYPDAKLMIFNRNGDLLWQKEHYGNYDYWGDQYNAWWWGTSVLSRYDIGKQTINGDPKLKVGNYVYVLQLGNGEVKNGTVMISY